MLICFFLHFFFLYLYHRLQSPAFKLALGVMFIILLVAFFYSKNDKTEAPAKKAPSPSENKAAKSKKI